ncbi:MAG: T9SS type A sorting domain-containing protein [Bacteroidia bacterium]|nr:T9SS type A sorting domain-containing protein [Bacteroidia bacterium]
MPFIFLFVSRFSPASPRFFFTLALIFALALVSRAQPVTGVFTPEPRETGDIVSLDLSYGTVSQPIEQALSVSVTLQYEGVDLIEAEPLTVSTAGSWFGGDGRVTSILYPNYAAHTIRVVMTRTDGVPKSGFGYLCRIDRWIVEVEEIIMKQPVPISMLATGYWEGISAAASPIQVWYDTPAGIIHTNLAISSLSISDLQGRTSHPAHQTDTDWVIPRPLTPGVYLVRVMRGRETVWKRLVLP